MTNKSDFDLCREFLKCKGEVMYYSAAEGQAWNAESASLYRAKETYKELEQELEERGITQGWLEEIGESSKRLHTVFTIKGKEYIFA